jgi:hypothetical protein
MSPKNLIWWVRGSSTSDNLQVNTDYFNGDPSGTGTRIIATNARYGDSQVIVNGNTYAPSSMAAGTWHKFELRNIDWSNDQIKEVKFNGETLDTNVAFQNSGSAVDYLRVNRSDITGSSGYWDDLGSSYTSGSITSTQKTLNFTPSKVLVEQEATSGLDVDELEYIISDSNNNSVKVQQDEIGTEKSFAADNGDVTVDINIGKNGSGQNKIKDYGVMFV